MRYPTFVFLALGLLAQSALSPAQQGDQLFSFQETSSTQVKVSVDASRASAYQVPASLFGKFTENLGFNVYGGLWAQVLSNPSLEPASLVTRTGGYRADEANILQRMTRERPITPGLERQIAYSWFAWNAAPQNCSFSSDAFNTSHSQLIVATEQACDQKPQGIRQPVYLPLHQESTYELSCYLKDTTVPLVAQLISARTQDKVYGRAELTPANRPSSQGWQEYTCQIEVQNKNELEPLWLCLGATRPGRVQIDQLTLWPKNHEQGFEKEVVDWLRGYGVKMLRFPGGNYVSGYHWKDDLVALEKRPSMLNPAWDQCDPHHVGTDEYVTLCNLIGAEPLICVNVGDGTPEEAADWVEYCNGPATSRWGKVRAEHGHPEPYAVKNWEVGNELWGFWQVGHCSAKEYARRYLKFQKAMRERDPSIRLIACGHLDPNWNSTLVEQCTTTLEQCSVHLLHPTNSSASPVSSYLSQMGYSYFHEDLFRSVVQMGREHGVNWGVAVTEMIGIAGERSFQVNPSTLAEALYFTGSFNSAVRTQGAVTMLTYSAVMNHGGGLRKEMGRVYATPAFYARRALTPVIGARPVACTVQCPFSIVPEWQSDWMGAPPRTFPLVDAMPLLADKKLYVILVNRMPDEVAQTKLDLRGASLGERVETFELSGESFMAVNDPVHPERVTPRLNTLAWNASSGQMELSMPPHSVTLLTFERR